MPEWVSGSLKILGTMLPLLLVVLSGWIAHTLTKKRESKKSREAALENARKDLLGPLNDYLDWIGKARSKTNPRDPLTSDILLWSSELIDFLTKDPRIFNWCKQFKNYSLLLPGFVGVVELIQQRQLVLYALTINILQAKVNPGEESLRAFNRFESCLVQQAKSIDQLRLFLQYFCHKDIVKKPGPFSEGEYDYMEMDKKGKLTMVFNGKVFPPKYGIDAGDIITYLSSPKAT